MEGRRTGGRLLAEKRSRTQGIVLEEREMNVSEKGMDGRNSGGHGVD